MREWRLLEGTSTPTVLVPELLSFSPHFLLDDTINIANDGVGRAVDAMEDFLNRWAETRLEREPDWDDDKELEQGLVSFQTVTLLEFHTDIAFDFFEAWSLRNIFAVPADLPLKEAELLAEIDELWREIEKAMRTSGRHAKKAQLRLDRLAILQPDHPHATRTRRGRRCSLLPEPGKREWELGRAGYISWVNAQLLRHANTATGSTLESASVEETPGAKHVSAALCALEHDDS
ncbi:Mis12-domain-containing protein [Lactarius deliciosus]|nr:Mis12-domain-containing protein [Lactarius deliciosus]